MMRKFIKEKELKRTIFLESMEGFQQLLDCEAKGNFTRSKCACSAVLQNDWVSICQFNCLGWLRLKYRLWQMQVRFLLIRRELGPVRQQNFVAWPLVWRQESIQKQRAKIWVQEYIDLGSLLSIASSNNSYSLSCKSTNDNSSAMPKLCLEPNKKSGRIFNINQWLATLNILMNYCETFRDIAAKRGDWRYYDEQFRFLKQSDRNLFPCCLKVSQLKKGKSIWRACKRIWSKWTEQWWSWIWFSKQLKRWDVITVDSHNKTS